MMIDKIRKHTAIKETKNHNSASALLGKKSGGAKSSNKVA